MTLLRISLLSIGLLLAWLAASEAAAQVGYYRTYRADPYRELSQTGKYHGYWRDLGYGVNAQPNGNFYSPNDSAPYYSDYGYPIYGGVPYGVITPAPNYYHPPRSFPYRYRW